MKTLLHTYESSEWPRIVNRRGYEVSKKAFRVCEVAEERQIRSELARKVLSERRDGTKDLAQIGHILAAKRASKYYNSSRAFQRAAGRELARELGRKVKDFNYREAWLRVVREREKAMIGARIGSIGFLRAGFWSIGYHLAKVIGLSWGVTRKGFRGPLKGSAIRVATSSNLFVQIENRAHSKSEKRGGFERIGNQALQAGIDSEEREMAQHAEKRMAEGARIFNRP